MASEKSISSPTYRCSTTRITKALNVAKKTCKPIGYGDITAVICEETSILAGEAMRPAFITFEGGEGVGKSSLISRLSLWLKDRGLPVEVTREPGGTEIAEKIREIFKNPPSNESLSISSEFFLVSAARSQHCDYKLRKWLDAGSWVLCDRFVDSSLVYQGLVGGLDVGFVKEVIKHSTKGLMPDLTLLLDCPVAVSQKRLALRQNNADNGEAAPNRYDDAASEFHERVRQAYLDIAGQEPSRMKVIHADRGMEAVFEQACEAMRGLF